MMDTTVLYPVVSPKLSMTKFTYVLWESCEIRLTQRRDLFTEKYFSGSMPLLSLATVLGHVMVPRLSPLPQYLRSMVEKLAWDNKIKVYNVSSGKDCRNMCIYREFEINLTY